MVYLLEDGSAVLNVSLFDFGTQLGHLLADRFAGLLNLSLQFLGAGAQLVVGEGLNLGIDGFDLFHERLYLFHIAVALVSEELANQFKEIHY